MEKRELSFLPSLLLTLFSWVVFFFSTTFYFTTGLIFCVPVGLFSRPLMGRRMHWIVMLWGRTMHSACMVLPLRTRGFDRIDRRKIYVIASNHQSLLDIFIMLVVLPVPFKFMAKKELFSLPFLGWHMSCARYIPIERGNAKSGRGAMENARSRLAEGDSVLFFPEGTRSTDGNIKAFKPGAFKVAMDAGVEVLPVILDGTGNAIPKNTWMMRRVSPLKVWARKPIKADEGESLEAFMERVRTEMTSALAEMRAS